MVRKEDVKPGLLVWWSAERYMNSWSCPAVVTVVEEKWFRVRNLDDFKETVPLRMDDVSGGDKSVLTSEMRVCTLDEVKDYFKERRREFEDTITKKIRGLKDAQEAKVGFEEKAEAFLKTF